MLRQLWTGAHDIVERTGFVQCVQEESNGETRYNLQITWTEISRGISPPTLFRNSKKIGPWLNIL